MYLIFRAICHVFVGMIWNSIFLRCNKSGGSLSLYELTFVDVYDDGQSWV
jgi:hypothetical protein